MDEPDKGILGFGASQVRLFVVVLVVGVALAAFYVLKRQGIDDSAALYVGLPLVLALMLSLTPKTVSTGGAVMKGLTIAILLSAPVFMEGFICILMASPILYSVAGLVAWLVDRFKRKSDSRNTLQLSLVAVVLTFASLEGTQYQIVSFTRDYQVEYSETVGKDIESIRRKLSQPVFSKSYRPLFLRVFPYPERVSGAGLHVGAEHKLDYVYKKWFVANAHKGSTVYRVAELADNYVRFDIPHDDSYLSHYLTWQASEVLLEPLGADVTKITWKLSYKRNLDPAWYFGPLQYYAAWLTAKVLVNNATS